MEGLFEVVGCPPGQVQDIVRLSEQLSDRQGDRRVPVSYIASIELGFNEINKSFEQSEVEFLLTVYLTFPDIILRVI